MENVPRASLLLNKRCFFCSDLHGNLHKYRLLFKLLREKSAQALFLGGDLFSRIVNEDYRSFFSFLKEEFLAIKRLQSSNFEIFLILGNDDPRSLEDEVRQLEEAGVWFYLNRKLLQWEGYSLGGYNYIPPSPFLLKDWEKYDLSRYLDVGAVPPEEGIFSTDIERERIPFETIAEDLQNDLQQVNPERLIVLFHAPPYDTPLDLADLSGKMVDYAPLDQHIGSIAIRQFIEQRQPLLTLHGHVHESFRLSGQWRIQIGRSWSFSAAAERGEFVLISFDLQNLEQAERIAIRL